MGLTEREQQYDPEEIKSAIKNHQENIKTFEAAIEREYASIKRYREILAQLTG